VSDCARDRRLGPSVVIKALLLVAAGFALAGCSISVAETYAVTLPGKGPGSFPIEVRLADYTRLTTSLELLQGEVPGDPEPPDGTSVDPIPGRANAVALTWIGGACDESVDLEIRDAAPVVVTLTPTTRGGGGCGLVAMTRTVVIGFVPVIDIALVEFEVQP
jgi:hypothetical protein